MSEPSAPKPIPSSRRLRMADQNRACRLLREAIPGDVSRRALSWRAGIICYLMGRGVRRSLNIVCCTKDGFW